MRVRWLSPLKLYVLAVVATFAFGIAFPHSEGWSFLPTMILTLPWSMIPVPNGLFAALTAYDDLPLFLCGMILNIVIVYIIRIGPWKRST
ncbi:MAG TPA: hypothetical protein VF018_15620 [Acidobacteriaceae bacterium]